MEITLYNIQGFRGFHQYTIDDYITIINSRENGVGKTTLYDCLKMLSDSTSMDKEEQGYFLNLNETESMFSVKKEGVTHGFMIVGNKPPVFFREFEGEEAEHSNESFPTAAQDVGVLILNGTLFNIFSKEVDLFSTSNGRKNYQLVQELTTHEETEEMLELMERSTNINKTELASLRSEKKGLEGQLEALLYFPAVDQLEELLNDTLYEKFEVFAEITVKSLEKFQEVETFNFNSKIEEMIRLTDSLDRIQHTDYELPKVAVLEDVAELSRAIHRLQVQESLKVDTVPLEQMVKVADSLDSLVTSQERLSLNTEPLEQLRVLTESLDQIKEVEQLEVDTRLPAALSKICITLGQMGTNLNRAESYEKILERNREKVQSVRVPCPIRQEVYLVDGHCSY